LLHYVPFHALHDGESYLVDRFTISYAPSASVYALCHAKQANTSGHALILGIADTQAPSILDEVEALRTLLPNAKLFVGSDATEDTLRNYGPGSRIVHIATHGYFRQDNPMFSSIRLGQSDLNLFDLYQLPLSAELVTLSGCGTGLNVVVGGDELLGLVRGLLYAGTRAVLATLWDVNDRSTAVFMTAFYQELCQNKSPAAALQHAMQDLRQRFPHPYHWAPFVLIGKLDQR
jgi:CHAT domain-containing protein